MEVDMAKMTATPRIKASELIKNAENRPFEMPCDEALTELRKVLAYNDKQGALGARARISAEKVCQMLASWDYTCCKGKLHTICQRLGRKSYAHA
jgi:hypothetical protein